MSQKRRALVLTDESARHWFLRSLPPHVRHGGPVENADGGMRRSGAALTSGGWRSFLTTYCCSLVAITTFIM
ncbi:hypothetical protein [Novosphingobium aquimarinum]|uniref:hypothetical protein n=1 Tax=Novosphingobium aquimarinum TaxID=2682494 RepID=UPI0012EB3B8B|nr:hypothetical protein [Novosphingobium aquimarinum]